MKKLVISCIDILRKHQKKILPWIVVGVFLIAAVAVYMTFYFTQPCQNFECFMVKMQACEKGITYINDDKQATWKYSIIEKHNDETCDVEVKMLQAKEGVLGMDKLVGYSMDCAYPLGYANYPEKDLSKCHGRLKEELQGIVIQRLHTYIIDNLGKIAEGLEGV